MNIADLITQRNLLCEQIRALDALIVERASQLIERPPLEAALEVVMPQRAEASLDNWKTQKKQRKPAVIARALPDATQAYIPITKSFSLPAVSVAAFSDVKRDGKLHYIASSNHFAIYICDHLFHGNIGKIYYNSEKAPMRIKNCSHHTSSKSTTCQYYHNPLNCSDSNDVRNYVANSWVYNIADNETGKYKRFGNIDTLSADISAVTDDEKQKLCDMVFHDLLCILLLLG